MSLIYKLLSVIEKPIIPPFKGVAVLFWGAFVLLFIKDTAGPLWHGNLSDPDDFLYLVQALDWLKGQDWFDPVQHRMNPPEGTYVHYAQILSGFYAGFIFLFRALWDDVHAAFVTAVILPPIYLALLLFALEKIAQVLIHKDWGGLTAYVAVFSGSVLSLFAPGHIDHHGLELVLTLCAFGCVCQMVLNPKNIFWPMAAGLCLALSLVIALEVVAVLSLLTLGIGIWAMAEGGSAARNGAIYGLTLFAASLGLLFATHAGTQAFFASGQAYSIIYVVLTGCFALCFAGVWAFAKNPSIPMRFIVGGSLAGLSGFFFLHFFPELRAGPFGSMDPQLLKLLFSVAPESWPLFRSSAHWNQMIFPLICPLLGIWASLFMAWQSRLQPQRWLWAMVALIVTVCTPYAAFYHMRLLYYIDGFDALPLAALVFHDWSCLSVPGPRRIFFQMRFAFILLIIPIAAIGAGKFDNDFSAASAKGNSGKSGINCDMHALAQIMNDRSGYGSHPRLVINSINEGPEILFRTPHTVLAGPYHMDASGNLDAAQFFRTSDPDEAKAIAQHRGADLVLLCPSQLEMQVYKGAGTNASFAQQLVAGDIPSWLKPVKSRDSTDLMLFEVR
jgi:hypothetical protein